jgi:UDPglucose 6-dehydrogenase
VPTPSDKNGKFVNAALETAIDEIIKVTKVKSHIICVVSTVMPGTCEYFLEKFIPSKLTNSTSNFEVVYSPEFIALGTVIDNMKKPDMILIGTSSVSSGNTVAEVLTGIAENNPPVQLMSLPSAELVKIAVNTYVTTKISYANMLSELTEQIPGADKYEVLKALGFDSRIGGKYLSPGLGFGGPCFPRDNKALSALGKSIGVKTEIANATTTINKRQPKLKARLINRKFLDKSQKILVLGLSYKPGSFVTEESQAVMLVHELSKKWKNVYVHDPQVQFKGLFSKKNIFWQDDLSKIDDTYILIVAVKWKEYLEIISEHPNNKIFLV